MNKRKSIEMTFECDADASHFTCTSKGEFCAICKEEVIDFTKYSISEIRNYEKKHGTACGKFTSAQTDPYYILPIAPVKKIRSLAFLSGLFVLVGSQNVAAQSTSDPKKEQSEGTSNAPNFTEEQESQILSNGSPVSMSVGDSGVEHEENEGKPKEEQRSKKRHKAHGYYLSWRFPFVHKIRKFRGKFKF